MLVVSDSPTIADLNTPIVIKLTSYLDSPTRRAQDLADVVRLVEANGLGREFAVDAAGRAQCLTIPNGLEAAS